MWCLKMTLFLFEKCRYITENLFIALESLVLDDFYPLLLSVIDFVWIKRELQTNKNSMIFAESRSMAVLQFSIYAKTKFDVWKVFLNDL